MHKLTAEEQKDLEAFKKIEYQLHKQYEKLIELDIDNKQKEKENITRDIMCTLIEEIPFISKYSFPSKSNNLYNYLEETEKPIDIDSVNYYCVDNIDSLINRRIMVYLQPFVFQSEEYKNKVLNGLKETKEKKEESFKIAVKTNETIKNDMTKILISNIEEVLEKFPSNIKKELIKIKYNIIFINNSIENIYLQEDFNYIDFPYIEGKLKLEITSPASGLVYDDLLNYKSSNLLLYTLIKLNNYYNDLDLDDPKKLKEIIIYLATIKTAMSGANINTIKENIELMQIVMSSKNKNIAQLAILILKDYEKTKNKHRVISLRRNTK